MTASDNARGGKDCLHCGMEEETMRMLLVPALAGVGLALSVAAAFADSNPPDFRDVQTWPALPPGKSASDAAPGQIVTPDQAAEAAQPERAAPAVQHRKVRGAVGVQRSHRRVLPEEGGQQSPHM